MSVIFDCTITSSGPFFGLRYRVVGAKKALAKKGAGQKRHWPKKTLAKKALAEKKALGTDKKVDRHEKFACLR
jgi:hypothetical protein